jgi:hypothetical protein
VIVCTRSGKPRAHAGFRIEGTGDVDGSIPTKYYTIEKESVREFLGECDVVVSSAFFLFHSSASSSFSLKSTLPSPYLTVLPSSKTTHQFIGREELIAMKVHHPSLSILLLSSHTDLPSRPGQRSLRQLRSRQHGRYGASH